jgi:hypothetical protein
MTARAAHLVDHVLPDVPVRQTGAPAARLLRGGVEWVSSLPPRIRYLLAWHHDLCKSLVGALLREVNRHLRHRARAAGVVDPRGGAVAIVQRFGGALNLKQFSDRPCTPDAGRGTSAYTDAGGPMRAYSMDLRARVLLDSDAGMTAADVAGARATWHAAAPTWDPTCLVCLDETGVTNNVRVMKMKRCSRHRAMPARASLSRTSRRIVE